MDGGSSSLRRLFELGDWQAACGWLAGQCKEPEIEEQSESKSKLKSSLLIKPTPLTPSPCLKLFSDSLPDMTVKIKSSVTSRRAVKCDLG